DQQIVGSPVCREKCDRRGPRRADPDLLTTVAAVFRPKDQLFLIPIEIAFRPTVVVALFESDDFFGREIRPALRFVVLRPVLRELIPAMLCDEQPSVGVDRKAFAVADTGCIAFSRREFLVGLVRIIAPRAAAGLLLRAGLKA